MNILNIDPIRFAQWILENYQTTVYPVVDSPKGEKRWVTFKGETFTTEDLLVEYVKSELSKKVLSIINNEVVLSETDCPWRYAPEYAATRIIEFLIGQEG